MNGIYEGVNWVKTQHADMSKGYTTVIVNREEVKFYGHKSNAHAWNFISKIVKMRDTKVVNGAIITKAAI